MLKTYFVKYINKLPFRVFATMRHYAKHFIYFISESYSIRNHYHTHFIDQITEAEGRRLPDPKHIALSAGARICIPSS